MAGSITLKNIDAWKVRLLLGIKIMISAGLIFYLTNKFSDISFTTFLDFNSGLPFFAAIALVPVNFFLQYRKWRLICDHSFRGQKSFDIFKSVLTGIATGLLTPGRLGEYPGRAFPLREVKLSEVTAGAAIDKLNSLLVILIAGSFSAVVFLNSFYKVDINLTLSLLFLLTGVYLLLLYLMLTPDFWRDFVGAQVARFKIIEKHLINFHSIGLFNRGVFGKNFAFSVLNYIVFSSQFVLLVIAYNGTLTTPAILMASSLVFFTKSLIPGITFGEIGIRESAAVFFFGHFDVPAGAAFNAALMLYTINVLLPAIPGAIFIFRSKR